MAIGISILRCLVLFAVSMLLENISHIDDAL